MSASLYRPAVTGIICEQSPTTRSHRSKHGNMASRLRVNGSNPHCCWFLAVKTGEVIPPSVSLNLTSLFSTENITNFPPVARVSNKWDQPYKNTLPGSTVKAQGCLATGTNKNPPDKGKWTTSVQGIGGKFGPLWGIVEKHEKACRRKKTSERHHWSEGLTGGGSRIRLHSFST